LYGLYGAGTNGAQKQRARFRGVLLKKSAPYLVLPAFGAGFGAGFGSGFGLGAGRETPMLNKT
jgi:hypothetical protein